MRSCCVTRVVVGGGDKEDTQKVKLILITKQQGTQHFVRRSKHKLALSVILEEIATVIVLCAAIRRKRRGCLNTQILWIFLKNFYYLFNSRCVFCCVPRNLSYSAFSVIRGAIKDDLWWWERESDKRSKVENFEPIFKLVSSDLDLFLGLLLLCEVKRKQESFKSRESEFLVCVCLYVLIVFCFVAFEGEPSGTGDGN